MTGRPSGYTQETADIICHRMAEGESLREVCRDPAMPSTSTVMRWAIAVEAFREQYTRAREALLEHWAEEITEIADDGSNDYMDRLDKDGKVIGEVVNQEHIARSRLRVDTRKWLLSKLKPKKYGDKLELSGDATAPVAISIIDGKL